MAPLARPPSPHRVRVTPAFRSSSLSVPGRTPLAQSRPRELWLAIHLPSLLLDSLRDVALALPGRPPVAIVDLERNGRIEMFAGEQPEMSETRRAHALLEQTAGRVEADPVLGVSQQFP